MKNTFIYPTLSAVIVGLILAAASVYIFSPKQISPVDDIAVEYRKFEVPEYIFQAGLVAAAKDAGLEQKIAERVASSVRVPTSVGLVNFRISNGSTRLVERMTVSLGDFTAGVMADGRSYTPIPQGKESIELKILPENSYEISLLVGFASTFPPQRFLVNGEAVPIQHMEMPSYEKPVLPQMLTYAPITVLVLSTIGAFTVILGSLGALERIYLRDRPHLLAGKEDTGRIARSLALMNWIRDENPARYEKILRHAEQVHARWQAPLSEESED